MEIPDRGGKDKPFIAPRHLALAAAIIASLGAIALLGPALNPTATIAPLPSTVEEAATPSPSPIGTPLPQPTPIVLPTPSPAPMPTPVPTEPQEHVSVDLVGTAEVAVDEHGIWTRSETSPSWTLNDDRAFTQRASCGTESGGRLAFVEPTDGEASSVAWFDPALPGWLDATEPLPPIPQSEGFRSQDYCYGALTSDGRLLFATATNRALILAVEGGDGSFLERTIIYPDDWVRGDSPDFVSVRPLRHSDSIIAAHCSYYLDTGCLTTYFRLDSVVAGADAPGEMSWAEAGGEIILPSPDAEVTVFADLGGSTRQGFDLRQVGNEVWAIELIEELGYIQGPDWSLPVGQWAAGPLGQDLIPLGSGNTPVLAVAGDSVIAAMIPLGEPTRDGAWNQGGDDVGRWANFDDWQRWSFDRAARRWQSLRDDPTDSRLPEQVYTVPALDWARTTSATDLDATQQNDERTWDDVVGDGSPIIVADRAFVHHEHAVWVSDDRGQTWMPHAGLAWSPGQSLCAASYSTGFAYFADIDAEPATLTIENGAETAHITWPLRQQVFASDQGFRPCRPMWMDGRWWVGEVDHEHRTLRLFSTADGQNFDRHTIELRGQLQTVAPGSGGGTVDLYRDNGQIVVRLCRSGEGRPCVQSVELELDAARPTLVSGPADNPYFAAEAPTSESAIDLEMRLTFHEVGNELWSVEINSIAGDIFGYQGKARVGRYGARLERVDGEGADVRLRNGQIMRCSYAYAETVEPDPQCATEQPDGSWQPVLGPIAVDWDTVPAGTAVTFWDRTEDGVVLVVPS